MNREFESHAEKTLSRFWHRLKRKKNTLAFCI